MDQKTPQSGLSQFLSELKRRHVGRVAIAYAAVVFVLLQAAEIILPAFWSSRQSEAGLRIIVVAFVLLLPVVLALAWVYEITPQGVRSMAALDAEHGRSDAGGRLMPRVAFLVVTILAAMGAGLWWFRTDQATVTELEGRRRQQPTPTFMAASTTDPSGPIRSLAVLPLENFSPDSEGSQDYFVAGMQEALISQLSQITAFRVISRTTVLQYDATGKSIPQIGQDLGVDAVVEGSVLRADGRVRITVQLVHAPSDTHIWARDYERDFGDVIALQREVAQAIANEIQTRLEERQAAGEDQAAADHVAAAQPEAPPTTAGKEATLTAAPPAPAAPEVQDAFLRGRFALTQGSPEAVEEAQRRFGEALSLDSTFTPALVGLAGTWLVEGVAGDSVSLPRLIEARRLAQRALEQDPTSTEAEEVMTSVSQALADYGQRVAEQAAAQTSRIRVQTLAGDSVMIVTPDDSMRISRTRFAPVATEFGGLLQTALARRDSAQDGAESSLRGLRRLEAAGHFHDARRRAEEAVARFPENEELMDELERIQALTGQLDAALATRRMRQARFGPGAGPDADDLADAVDADGAAGYWSWRLRDLRARADAGETVSPVWEGEALASLGRNDEALAALERARAARDPHLFTLRANPVWDSLRSDPRFQSFLGSLRPDRSTSGRQGPRGGL